MTAPTHIDVTCFVQIEPEWGGNRPDGSPTVRSAKAVNLTQKRPTGTQRQGTIMMPVTFRIPRAAFLPLSPQVVVKIPEDLISTEPIVVRAGESQ